jgi:hypothetical protein
MTPVRSASPRRAWCSAALPLLPLLLPLLLCMPPAPATAQTPRTAIHPQEILVGDVFRAVISLEVPAGTRIVFPDSLPPGAEMEAAGRRELRSDTTAEGRPRLMAAYPLAAWRPGPASVPPVEVRLIGDGFDRTVTAHFPPFEIGSVLPADTAGVEPRGLKDVFGGDRIMWPWLLAALLLALAIAALLAWRRSRRPTLPVDPRSGVVDPRVAALAALADARGVALAGNGELRRMYIEISDTLRYLIAVEMPALSHDLTTTELAPRLAGAVEAERARTLQSLLERADLVKFARARPQPADGLADWRTARAWVETLPPRHVPDAEEGADESADAPEREPAGAPAAGSP